MTCSICNSFLLTLRQAKGRGDDAQFEAVKALYLAHLETHNLQPAPVTKVNRDQVRAMFGRWGE